MPYKDRPTEKVYFRINEVADMVRQQTSALRFGEKEIPTLSPKLGKKGHRQYTRDDIAIVKQINTMVNGLGMTLKGVRQAYEGQYVERLIEINKDYAQFNLRNKQL